MVDRKRLMVWTAAAMLVALQHGIASDGYAHEGITEYLPEVRAQLVQPELMDQMEQQAETTVAALQADSKAKLEQHVRRSTREALAAAWPTEEAASQAVAENRDFDARTGEAG